MTNPFAAEVDWLERKRLETLRDLDSLKGLLAKVKEQPWEERNQHFAELLRQVSGCYGTLKRLDRLREWTR